mmetsp:Transcript_23484/g.65335  ORF Transcript_23484/g.65335 Transcript_23484/m.65335 type:complete len:295 (-) Transcript_23484:162-1046(-)|eukprot:CAMPEP_0168741890 /NCGR_PEP_ID=MMETSP0724-20121128/12756_1 /TAXON_ID=265536 /ORGANISM="Amphiprora sp., Strain CCMP467" /LENGTH=294 /DNA_ID=CAMNT_0008789427 /DNA_START=128 /DNA_END=1012 /DNA_ORIENTATION=-
MLAADKLQLQSSLKQQATALKEKEFTLHHSNFMTVGTQAAVLAGLDITMFIEFNPPDDAAWSTDLQWLSRTLRCIYYTVIVGAFCANMIVVSHTTALSVLGAGLALRGPDGSMMTATEGLYEERAAVFKSFAVGLALTVGSVLLSVWLLLRWEAAAACFVVALWTTRKIFTMYRRVQDRFDFDESDTVDFTDIFSGPAAIRAVPIAETVNQVQTAVQKVIVGSGTSSSQRGGGGGYSWWGRSNSAPDNYEALNGGGDGKQVTDNDDDVELGKPQPTTPQRAASSRLHRRQANKE